MFRDDIFAFAKTYMSTTLRPHQLDWLEQIHNGGKRVLVLAPRGHGKSTIIRIYIMYRICHDPDIKILMASHVESLAKLQARAIQMYIELPAIQQDFGFSKGRPWSVSTFHLAGKIQPVMATVAARGGMVGKRFDIVIFDDLLSLENCINESSRDKILNWIRAEVLPAIDPYDPKNDPYDKEKMIVIGTRKHQKDWYSILIESDLYTKVLDVAYMFKCVYCGTLLKHNEDRRCPHCDGEIFNPQYLWPEKFNKEVLDMKKIELGPRLFAQEFMNEVAPSEGMLLKREWIKTYDELPPKHCYKVAMGVDPSMGKTDDWNSSLAIAVIAYDTRPEFHHIYVMELFKKRMSLIEQEQKIIEMYNKYKPVGTNIESVLVNTTFSDRMIAKIPGANPIDYIHTRLKGTSEVSKINRIHTLVGYYFEDGQISLRDPNYNDASREFIETEYIEFPDGEKDLLDALNLAVDLVEFERALDGPLVWTPSF
jgi:hypothetical protein